MTGKVRLGSDLQRRNWLKDGLLDASSHSFWQKYTDASSRSVIYQEIDTKCGNGHTVVFDYDGKLTGKAYKGDDYTYGKGEVKRKFSDKIAVDEFSFYVDNGSKFDACDIDDLSLSQHSDSRSQLADLFIRHKDQAIFDTLQGVTGQAPSHVYDLGTTFEYNDLLLIENAAKKGQDLKGTTAEGVLDATVKAPRRAPLTPWRRKGSRPTHICIIDNFMATKLKLDPKYQTIIINADVRGNGNRALDFVIGQLGNVIYIEAPVFFGMTSGKGASTLFDTEIEFSGLRQYAKLADGSIAWEGQIEFDKVEEGGAGEIFSRGLLLGAGAGQTAFGKMPNYNLEWGTHKKTSESMLEFWFQAKKTFLSVEAGTNYRGKVADIDYGVIAVDMKH